MYGAIVTVAEFLTDRSVREDRIDGPAGIYMSGTVGYPQRFLTLRTVEITAPELSFRSEQKRFISATPAVYPRGMAFLFPASAGRTVEWDGGCGCWES